MNTLIVRLTPWAQQRIERDYGPVSVATIRQSLHDFPATEFHTVWTPIMPREGAVVDVGSGLINPGGFDQMEVRFNNDRDLAIVVARDGKVVVR